MDRVVVIGGAGFIGSHVADELTRRGYQVTIFDRSPSPWAVGKQEVVVGDILDRELLTNTCEGARYVYHFGGIADIAEAKENPLKTIQTNIIGSATVLEVALAVGLERFLFASTMYVYSGSGSFYRASKQSVEMIVEAYAEDYAVEYTFLRYGSLYGPRAQEWNGLRRYVKQIVEEGQLEYEGTGAERREYIHVLDAARLSVDVLDEKHRNQAVIVTGSQVLNSSELADMIFEIAGLEKNVKFIQGDRSGDHYQMTPYRYTPKQARKLVPSEFIDLGQGILEMVEEMGQEKPYG